MTELPSGAFTTARHLSVGDRFIPADHLAAAIAEEWHREVMGHDYAPLRGDYSTVVGFDGTEWTERFDPDDAVYLLDAVPAETTTQSGGDR